MNLLPDLCQKPALKIPIEWALIPCMILSILSTSLSSALLFEFNALAKAVVKAYVLLEFILSWMEVIGSLLILIVLVPSLSPVLEVSITLI